jgi:hypothetical protein
MKAKGKVPRHLIWPHHGCFGTSSTRKRDGSDTGDNGRAIAGSESDGCTGSVSWFGAAGRQLSERAPRRRYAGSLAFLCFLPSAAELCDACNGV